jgi:Holliday junction resolvasome RuvABC endonuclease subunit
VVRILSLDPSSKTIGWAVLNSGKDPLERFGVLTAGSDDAIRRTDFLGSDLLALARPLDPDRIVMEWASPKVNAWARKTHGGAGLTVLGQAQGFYRGVLIAAGLAPPSLVTEREWARGKSKDDRTERVALEFPDYRAAQLRGEDPGQDAADAIGLALYWLARHAQAALLKGAAR